MRVTCRLCPPAWPWVDEFDATAYTDPVREGHHRLLQHEVDEHDRSPDDGVWPIHPQAAFTGVDNARAAVAAAVGAPRTDERHDGIASQRQDTEQRRTLA